MSKKPANPRTAIRFSPFAKPPLMWQQHRQLITTPTHKHTLPRPANSERGFSLVEVAISMIFYGLLIAGVAAAAKVDRAEKNRIVNPERLATITAALEQPEPAGNRGYPSRGSQPTALARHQQRPASACCRRP